MSQDHPDQHTTTSHQHHHHLIHHEGGGGQEQQHHHHTHHHHHPPGEGTRQQDGQKNPEEGGGGEGAGEGDDDDDTTNPDNNPNNKSQKSSSQQKKPQKNYRITLTEKIKEFCTRADVFATAHILPVHVICIIVATVIVPISAVSIIWDLLAAVVFQIPNWSTINLPAFVLFINFIAMPVAMYGYMMEFLMHEHSRLALIGLLCVVVHPILFLIRSLIEVYFDGYRGEEKVYFEAFERDGPEAKYPIGIVRFRRGSPFSDSEKGRGTIADIFEAELAEEEKQLEGFLG